MHSPNYRRRFLFSFLRAFVVPPVVAYAACYCAHVNGILVAVLMTLSIPCSIILRSSIHKYRTRRAACSMGANIIPCAVGKYPGNIDIMFKMVKRLDTGYLMQAFADLLEEHQTNIINTRILWEDQIFCVDEGVLKFMFVTGFEHFERGEKWHERMDNFFGDGIFNTDGESWKKNRATARPFFSKNRVSDFAIFRKHTNISLDLLSMHAAERRPCDIQDLFSRFTLDTASEFLFGISLNTLQKPLPQAGRVKIGSRGSQSVDGYTEFDNFTNAFEKAQDIIARRGFYGSLWPVFELLRDRTEDSMTVIKQWLDPLAQRAVQRKLERQEEGAKLSLEDANYLDFLADMSDDVNKIRFDLLNLLLASRDTTAGLLTFAVYLLCVHPDVQKRLREEVREHIGEDGHLNLDGLKDMKYLDAVIKETLRLFPPVVLMLRCSKDTPLVMPNAEGSPFYLPPRTQVLFSSFLVHRRRDLWGSSCEDFHPDRWFDPALLSRLVTSPLMYLPFHAGPRLCLGQNFALNEAAYHLASLVRRFDDLELAPNAHPSSSLPPDNWKAGLGRQSVERVWPASSFTIYVKGGLWIRASESP